MNLSPWIKTSNSTYIKNYLNISNGRIAVKIRRYFDEQYQDFHLDIFFSGTLFEYNKLFYETYPQQFEEENLEEGKKMVDKFLTQIMKMRSFV